MSERVADAIGHAPVEERAGELAGRKDGQSPYQRNHGSAQQDQRRSQHHQHHVLEHVGGKDEAGKSIEGRGQRNPEREQAEQKTDCPPERDEGHTGVPHQDPAAEIYERSQHQRECGCRRHRP